MGWLVAAAVLVGLAIVVFQDGVVRGPAVTVTVVDDAVVRWVAGLSTPGLTAVWQALAHVGSLVTTTVLWFGLVMALLVLRRFRHLVVLLIATEVVAVAVEGLFPPRPRPFGVVIQTSWGGWALPSWPITALVVTLVGVLYTLMPEGRWRNTGKWAAAGLVALVGLARTALGADAPTDVLVGAALGVAILLLGFRWFTPNEVFPVSYRRGRSAYLDVTGPRGLAIRRAMQDQLGLVVEEVKPFRLAGSAGSTRCA